MIWISCSNNPCFCSCKFKAGCYTCISPCRTLCYTIFICFECPVTFSCCLTDSYLFRLVGSTVLPDDSTSNPFAALYTPTLQIFGVAFAPVILIRTAVPSTASLRHRRFAEIVAPFPKSCHLPVTSLYSTVKEEIVCPFWIYSSIETTSNFLIPFRLISRLPVVLPSSGAQYVSSYV